MHSGTHLILRHHQPNLQLQTQFEFLDVLFSRWRSSKSSMYIIQWFCQSCCEFCFILNTTNACHTSRSSLSHEKERKWKLQLKTFNYIACLSVFVWNYTIRMIVCIIITLCVVRFPHSNSTTLQYTVFNYIQHLKTMHFDQLRSVNMIKWI